MWEDNLGKVKARRSKNSKPYERPKSILRRVTDSVTGLLPQPSWLVNWLQSTSAKKEDSENDEVEEEQPVPSTSSSSNGNSSHREGVERESFIFRRPPGTSKEQSNTVRARPNVPSLDLLPEPVVVESSSREQIVQTNGDDDSNSESTSGCSSLLPHLEHKRESRNIELSSLGVAEPLSINQSSLQIIGSSLSKSLAVDLKNSRGRKTLSLHTFGHDTSSGITPTEESRFHKDTEEASGSFFDKDDTSLNRSAAKRDLSQPQLSSYGSKRPRFNITSFGPTAAEARRSLMNESVVDSPFYAGKTTYGGASAYRRATLQPSAALFPYVRSRIQARPASSAPSTSSSVASTSSSNVVLSSSAQRILQALEAMSTPVRDAKRIPAASNSKRSTSLQGEELSFTGFGLSRRRPNLGPPTSKLSVGTPAQIVTRPAPANLSQIEPALVSSTPISAQVGGKMRMRMSAPLRKSAPRIREDEDVESEELTAVPMPISIAGLPSFNLLPPSSVVEKATVVSTKSSVKTAAVMSSNGLVSSSMTSTSAARPAFTFSAPLVTVSPYKVDAAVSSKPLSFNFSSPLLVNASPKKTPEKETPTKPAEVELKSGSVLDVLRGKSQEAVPVLEPVTKSPPVLSGFGDKFKAPTDSWTCSVCCVPNSKDKSSCVACESPAPNAVKAMPIAPAAAAPVVPPTKGFGDQFKMTAAQWECSVCMIRNADKEDRCKSCDEARPGSKPAVKPSSVSTFKFGIQPGQQTAPKFGTESSTLTQTKGFSFGTSSEKEESSSSGFKFGASIEVSKDKSVTPGFKFGNVIEPSKKIEASSSESVVQVVEPSKIPEKAGFKFGTSIEPSKKTEETSGGFKFGIEKKLEETKAITSTAPVASQNTGPIELFQIKPKEPTQKAEEPIVFGRQTDLATDDEKKTVADSQFKTSVLSNPAAFNVAPTTTSSASKSSPIFSFAPAVPDSKVSLLETGSVMDILGKKPTAPSDIKQAPVSSASSFSFGATEQTKPTFAFGKPETSTEKPTFNFGEATEKESQIPKSTSSIPTTTTTTSTPFSFTGGATSTPSLSLFKPATAPSFNFGGPTVFGASVSSAPTFGASTTVATSTSPPFGITTSAPAPSTFGLPTTTASSIAFGLSTSTTSLPTFGSQTATAVAPTAFGMTAAPPSFSLPTTTTKSTLGSAVPASSSSLFNFVSGAGATPTTSTSTAAAPSMSFSFGTPQTTTASFINFGSPAPPAYQFPKDAAKPASSGGFGFGASTTSVPSSFAFGASNVATPVTTPSEAPKMQFNFATSQQTTPSTVAAPTFGTFGTGAPKTTSAPFSGFNATPSSTPAFGAAASSPFGSLQPTGFGAAAAAAAPFSFSAPSASASSAFTASSSFNFSGSAAAPASAAPPQQPPGLFQFGMNAAPPAVNSGFNFPPAATFNPPDAPSPGFAAGFPGANPFDNTGSVGGARKMRKAVRRR
ncbi:nuclear pore complex protein Nup153-like isoform X1 [Daphnia pulicaria]|uniref:nuclear pore complex protein Nup153-like isoform X1 n=1 Tax=Daphnia pulicaria TaxID=35523 RepID=UPI001EECBA65|nr:nuclear pore complex protein Nup153-like isoform X1 [Daphnia pulicaria]